MNEQVIDDLFNQAVSKGYKKSREEFVNLLHTNDAVLNDMYSYVQSKGYQKGIEDFSGLVGKKKGGTASISEVGSLDLPSGEKDTLIERTFGKNDFTNALGDIYRAYKGGAAKVDVVDPTMNIFGKKASEIDENSLKEFVEYTNKLKNVPVTDELKEYYKSVENAGGGFTNSIIEAIKNPAIIPQLTVDSFSMLIPVTGEGVSEYGIGGAVAGGGVGAGTGAALGAIGGPLAPVTSTAGAIAGGLRGLMAGMSGTTEVALSYGQYLQEEAQKRGLEFNEQNVKKLLEDQTVIDGATNRALSRGATVALVDAVTSGLAGKALGATKAAVKGTAGKALGTTAALGVESVGEGLGEGAAQVVSGQEVSGEEIALEMLGGIGGGVFNVGVETIIGGEKVGRYKINGEEVSKNRLNRFLQTATPDEVAKTNIEVTDDNDMLAVAEDKKKEALLAGQIDPAVTEETDKSRLVKLEKERAKLKGLDTKSAQNRVKAIDEEIDSITGKYTLEEAPKGVQYKIDGSNMDRARFVAAVEEANNEEALNELETTDPEVQKVIDAKRAQLTGKPVAEPKAVTNQKRKERIVELNNLLASDAASLQDTGTGNLIPEARQEIQQELETLKAEEDAVQKQAAGEVPVQPGTRVGQEVAQGEPQAEPQGVAQENQEKINDIEKRRQEELNTYDEEGLNEIYAINNDQTIGEFINAKYDAELAAIEKTAPVEEVKPVTINVADKYTVDEVERVKALPIENEDGATMNLDGTKYEKGGVVIPLASRNMAVSELTPEKIDEFVKENSESIGSDMVKVGIYKFPNSDQASIDINIVADRSRRDEAIEIARELGQESIFDLDTFENIKTGADGKNPKVLTPKEFLDIQDRLSRPKQTEVTVTPETSSNYANMTEDNEGNFVFFHVGKKGYDTIKKGTGASQVTSREEASALSKVGGLAMYYTAPEQTERQSADGAKYAVKVPKEKVYDFNTDKLNLIDEARQRHEAENPGKAFDTNSQIAYVTKIAGERGFDMVVADWAGGTRAQTTKELTPVDVQESTGNVIEKNFDNQYESNKTKGFTPVVPKRKADKLQAVYDKINEVRNAEKRYDNLYSLYTDSSKYTQEQITDLIEKSDLPQDIKNEYNEILGSKEETRRSEQKKAAPTNVEESIKNSAKTLQTSFPGVNVIVADNTEDAKKQIIEQLTPIVGEENAKNIADQIETARGQAVFYKGKPVAVVVNKEKAISNTAAHEVWHLILREAFGKNAKKFKSFQNAISRELKNAGYTDVADYLDRFSAEYEGDAVYEEYLAELGGLLTTKGFDPKNLTAQEKSILEKIKEIINKFAKSMVGQDVFLKDAKPENILQFMIDVSDLVAKGEDVRPAIGAKKVSKKAEKDIETSLQANFSDKESKLTFIYDKNSEKFDKLKRDGFINDDVPTSSFNGKVMLLHQPDAAFSGEIQKNGETIVEGKGGIFFPAKFHDDLLFWAGTKGTISGFVNSLNKISKRNGGKIYMALTSAPYHKLLSSTTMSNAVMDFFSSKVVDKNFKISEFQLKSSLVDAANATEVVTKKNKKGEIKKKIVGLNMGLSKKDSIESIKSKIAEKLGADNSIFDSRKLFSKELIRLMSKQINKNDVSITSFGNLFSEGIQNKYFKGITKTGKIRISAANMTQAISEMFTEPLLKEGFTDRSLGGEVYAVIEVDGEVEAVDIDKHESYPSAVKAKNPVKIHILKDRFNWNDVFNKEGETGGIKKSDMMSVYPSTGVSSIGLVLNAPSQEEVAISKAASDSGFVSDDLDVVQQKGLSVKELNNRISSLDSKKKAELLSIVKDQEYNPKKKVKAYKLFRVNKNNPGELFPLFVNSDMAVPVGYWVKAAIGEQAPSSKSGSKQVKSKLGALAFRPGWHSGDIPLATHIGEKSDKSDVAPSIRPSNQVWAEVEVADDFDWQSEALKRADRNKQGDVNQRTAHITDRLPDEGHYKYKTNSNMTGSWIISGEMKVLRVLSDDEVKSINEKSNTSDLKRLTPLDKEAYGFDDKGYPLDKNLNNENIIAEFYRYSLRNNLKNEVVDTLSSSEIEVTQQKQLPASVNEQINNVISEQKELGKKPVEVAREAAKYLKSTDAYNKLGDRDKAKVLSGVKRLSGMRVKVVSSDEYSSLRDSIKSEARKAATEAVFNHKESLNGLVNSVRALAKAGKISTFRAGVIISRIAKTNLRSPESVNKTLNYIADIFNSANLAMKISRARSLVKNAKRNINSKIGQNPDLFNAAKTLVSIDPAFIPTPLIDDYLDIMEVIGERAKVLSIKNSGELTAKMNVIINAVIKEAEAQAKAAEESKTSETTKEPKIKETPEESKKKANSLIKEILSDKLETSNITDPNDAAVARKIASINEKDMRDLLTEDKDGLVDYSKLNLLLGIRDNIKAGIVTHEAMLMATDVAQNRSVNTLTEVVGKITGAKILNGVTRTISKIKGAITNRGGVLEAIRSTPLEFMDDVIGNFNDKTIFNLTFGVLGSKKGMLDARLADLAAKADAAEKLLQNIRRTDNAVVEAKYKIMILQLQREFESNPGSPSVAPAIEFIDATLKAITRKESSLTNNDARILQKIKKEFGVKDANGDQTIDVEAIENSLTENDKKAMKLIDEINAAQASEALFTSSVIRGSRVNIINNYVHHAVLSRNQAQETESLINKLFGRGPNGKPSTKAGTLNERTPGAKAIMFDPVSASMRGARETLTDFYMTPAIREVTGMLNKLKDNVFDDPNSTEDQRDVAQALVEAVEEALEVTFQNHFGSDTRAEAFVKAMQKLGYQTTLASIPRAFAELSSNMSFAILSDPKTTKDALKHTKFAFSSDLLGFLEKIGSAESTRLAGNQMLTGKYAEGGFASGYGRTSKSAASSKVMDYASFITRLTVGKVYRTADVVSDLLISTPDKVVSKAYYVANFVNNFEQLTGIKLTEAELRKISDGTSQYLSPEFESAIQSARQKADSDIVRMAASGNSFNTILKNVPRKKDNAMMSAYRAINSFMSRFYLTEYGTLRSAVIALFKSGQIDRKMATAIIAASVTRMSMYIVAYSLLSSIFDSIIGEAFDLEEEDEEDEDLMMKVKRSIVGTGVGVLSRRTLGNLGYIPVAYGVEQLNAELGEDYGLREDEYDPFKNSLVYSKISETDLNTKSPWEVFGKAIAGPYAPTLSTIARGLTLYGRANKEGSKPETKKRAMEELETRMAFEAAGNLGLIPFYKDARRILMSDFYARNYDKKGSSSFTITQKQIDLIRKSNPAAARQLQQIYDLQKAEDKKLREFKERLEKK
jgi:hypothetical protein